MKESLKILKALADETRLKIVEFLLDGEKCVCEIIPHTRRKQSTVSIHLGKLENCGILESRRDGKKILYKINDFRVCNVLKALGYTKRKTVKGLCRRSDKNEC
ncbi:MAG: metalloregulator ArsR/SmtB family transcription factor [archaeon]